VTPKPNNTARRIPHKSPRAVPGWSVWLKWRYLLLGGFWFGMFIGTHLPKIPGPLRKVSDKTMHGLCFAGLAFLLAWATYEKQSAIRHWTLILGVIAVYGAFDELLQIPVGRHCDFNDWLADIAGAAVGMTLFHLTLIWRKSCQRKIPVRR